MSAVERRSGNTESERYLARLGERSFLNLWSYSNLFIDKKKNGRGDGKELCDLLVVCGDHVLIFSDKTVAWPNSGNVDTDWRRWFTRAILNSADQIRGAERWVDQFPGRVFLDPKCTQPFPIAFPPRERRKVHGIVVALGAGEACRNFFGGGIGSLVLNAALKGDDHFNAAAPFYRPFTIGDLDPQKSFIHVFDDATLDIVMRELDTISDFTAYLSKKEAFLRSGNLLAATGEEELLAYYMTHLNGADEHDFVKPDRTPWQVDEVVSFSDGFFADFIKNPQYIAKKDADRISYLWDGLITAFTDHMLAGTTIVPEGHKFVLSEHERGIRHMALVPRFVRRVYASGIAEALEKGAQVGRFLRAFVPTAEAPNRETGFFFLTMKASSFVVEGRYEQYRKLRRETLYGYALVLLRRYSHLRRVVGISSEPVNEQPGATGSSEDLVVVEAPEWTGERLAELEKYRSVLDLAKDGRFNEYPMSGNEYPAVRKRQQPAERAEPPGPSHMNRQQRRAAARRKKKARKKPNMPDRR